MKRFFLALALLAAPASAGAQSITVPATVTVEEPGLVVIRATAIDADDVRWYSIGPGMQTFPPDVVAPKPGVYLGFAMRPGIYKVGVIVAKDVGGKAVLGQPQVVVVTVKGDPVPPGPDPKPDPKPPVPPSPLPDGFRVLVVYESAEKLAPGHAAVIGSTDVRKYLNDKCLKVGGTPEWRMFDKDTPLVKESDVWKAAMTIKRGSLPWIIIGDGKTGFSGPLPGTVAETMTLLKKYGG